MVSVHGNGNGKNTIIIIMKMCIEPTCSLKNNCFGTHDISRIDSSVDGDTNPWTLVKQAPIHVKIPSSRYKSHRCRMFMQFKHANRVPKSFIQILWPYVLYITVAMIARVIGNHCLYIQIRLTFKPWRCHKPYSMFQSVCAHMRKVKK